MYRDGASLSEVDVEEYEGGCIISKGRIATRRGEFSEVLEVKIFQSVDRGNKTDGEGEGSWGWGSSLLL
ncbi:hypothetical protein B6U83_04715 [Thermoplasmatales archaeon ex4484_36]|nr:MAG: hypothetical protein B6U83_04715 [Thermoplasmatales archaeon ex4484_36]